MAMDISKLENSNHLLNLLIQMEDVLDSLDIYVYRNWFEGELLAGPFVGRYFISMVLVYQLDEMPDPRACLRLNKFNIKVEFKKIQRKKPQSFYSDLGSQQLDVEYLWWVKLSYPRRILDDMEGIDYDEYEDDVDMDDIEDAKDEGIGDKSAYEDNNGVNDEMNNDQE